MLGHTKDKSWLSNSNHQDQQSVGTVVILLTTFHLPDEDEKNVQKAANIFVNDTSSDFVNDSSAL